MGEDIKLTVIFFKQLASQGVEFGELAGGDGEEGVLEQGTGAAEEGVEVSLTGNAVERGDGMGLLIEGIGLGVRGRRRSSGVVGTGPVGRGGMGYVEHAMLGMRYNTLERGG